MCEGHQINILTYVYSYHFNWYKTFFLNITSIEIDRCLVNISQKYALKIGVQSVSYFWKLGKGKFEDKRNKKMIVQIHTQ